MTDFTWLSEHWLEIFGALAGVVYVLLEIRQSIWLWPVGIITSAVYVSVFFTSKFYADMSLQVYYLAISFYGWYFWKYGTRHSAKEKPEPGTRRPAPGIQQPATRTEAGTAGRTHRATGEVYQQPSTSNKQQEPGNQQQEPSNQQPAISNQNPATRNSKLETLNPQLITRTETGTAGRTHRATGEVYQQPATSNQQQEPSNQQPLALIVTRTPVRLALKLAAIYLLLHAVMWYVLASHTDSPVAGWDSFTTALSVIATWMLARKYIEHWIIWIIVNIVSMILYIYKGLYPTTVLFLVYTVMAFIGYREWHRGMKLTAT